MREPSGCGTADKSKPLTRARRVLLVVVAALTFTGAANAAPVQIARYDVEQTPASGFGGWRHFYTGTITDLGRLFGGSHSCLSVPCRVVNETGGSGTMNDGLRSGGHLFATRNDFAGVPIEPRITLYLGGTFSIRTISIYGGGFPDFGSATVEIAGASVRLASVQSGLLYTLDLGQTPLARLNTDRIVLRDITGLFHGFPIDQFSIAEIELDGSPLDTEPPVLTPPPTPFVVDASGPDGGTADYQVTAHDDADGALDATCDPPPGALFPIGDTLVSCTATDVAGNTASAVFTVHVRGAAEQLGALRESTLAADARQGVITSLDAKLRAVEAALAAATAGRREEAARALEAFLFEVRAQAGRALTEEQAADLAAQAIRIQLVLGPSA